MNAKVLMIHLECQLADETGFQETPPGDANSLS